MIMSLRQNTWRLLLLGAFLGLFGIGAWAATPHLAWIPDRLAPDSFVPGTNTSYLVTLQNLGPKPLSEAPHLTVLVRGDIAPYVTVQDPKFPGAIRSGGTIGITLRVMVPADVPLSVKRGELVLLKRLPDGTVKEEFSPSLPVEFTFSTIPMPGDPGEAGKRDLLGIDVNGNGVRDDIERYIVFAYPDSTKKREALMQNARTLNDYLRDHEDKTKTRENGKTGDRAIDCLAHVFNDDLEASNKAGEELDAKFLNTKERSRAYRKADVQMSGCVSDTGLAVHRLNRQKAACLFNADALPN
ncbi:MAG: hypothetical protein IPJ68_00280 [Candidatus Moraniibacteriota bacterium]|nr:MAG: hypothetical protein IPJ68_00280 [Candidatus Moranbacteria bacterium]